MSTLPAPILHGLRLGFTDLDAAADTLETVLGLTPIPVAPAPPPDRPARRHYALGGLRIEARASAPSAGIDTLQWQWDDLGRQRRHLQRLGMVALDVAEFGCEPGLRLEAIDTGACAVELREPAQLVAAPAVPGPRLTAIDLRVRAPERVAAHWAQLLGLPLGRDSDGAPLLKALPVAVRFVLAGPARASGVDALVLAADDAHQVAQRAAARGLRVAAPASWEAGGLHVRAQPA